MVSSSCRQSGADTSAGAIEIAPLTLHIGTEIRGVNLTKPLTPGQVKQVHKALLKWKVIFFQDQHLDHAQDVAMARQFGELPIGDTVFRCVEGYLEIYSVAKNRTANENRAALMVTPCSGWHSDITAAVNLPFVSILREVMILAYGVDTIRANLAAAHTALSRKIRGCLDGLRAIHKFALCGTTKPLHHCRHAPCTA